MTNVATRAERRAAEPVVEANGRRGGSEFAAVFAVLAVGCSALIGLRALNDNSFFTHLATGRLILETGSVPTADPYSYTSGGTEWVVQSWLASLFYGVTDEVFGGAGLRILTGGLCAILGWIGWRLTAAAGHIVVRAGAVAATLVVGGAMWSERPLLFGLIVFGVTMICLVEERSPLWLIPLFWMWVNTHGSYPLGLVLIATVMIGRKLDGLDTDKARSVARYAVIGILAGGLLNPYGPKMLLFPLRMLGRSDVLRNIREWQSPDFNQLWTQVFLVLMIAAIAALMMRPAWRLAIPVGVFFCASLLATRNVGLAAMVALPALAHGLPWTSASESPAESERKRLPVLAMVVAAGLGVVAMTALRQPDYALDAYPTEAVEWMVDQELRGDDFRLAHSDVVGNYLTIRFGDEARVFIDDRFEVHDDELIADYLTLRDATSEWEAVLDQRGVDAILWDPDKPLAQLVQSELDWTVAFADDDWIVACKPGACP